MEASRSTASATRKANPRKRARTNHAEAPSASPSSASSSSSTTSPTPLSSSSGTSPRFPKTRRPAQRFASAGSVPGGESHPTRTKPSPAALSRSIVTSAATSSLLAATSPGQQVSAATRGPWAPEQGPCLPGPLGHAAPFENPPFPASFQPHHGGGGGGGLFPSQEPYANPLSPAGWGHQHHHYPMSLPLPDHSPNTFVIPQPVSGLLPSYPPTQTQLPFPPYLDAPDLPASLFLHDTGALSYQPDLISHSGSLTYPNIPFQSLSSALDTPFDTPFIHPIMPAGMSEPPVEIAQQDGGWMLLDAAHTTPESRIEAQSNTNPSPGVAPPLTQGTYCDESPPPLPQHASNLHAGFGPAGGYDLVSGAVTSESPSTFAVGGDPGRPSTAQYTQNYDPAPTEEATGPHHPSWYEPRSMPIREPSPADQSEWVEVSIEGAADDSRYQAGRFDAPSKGKPKVRRPLASDARAETNATRKWKACVRCRMQKIRCRPGPGDSEICQTCTAVDKDSKKVIHSLPCKRWILTEVVLFRDKSLGLTARWPGMEVEDIPAQDWASTQVRVIGMNLGFYRESMQLEVREFKPARGDKINRFWKDKAGKQRETQIGAYALASTTKTQAEYRRYMQKHARQAMSEYSRRHPEPIIRETYEAAQMLLEPDEETQTAINAAKDAKETETLKTLRLPTELMNNYVEFWFAVKNTIGSAHLDESMDLLDMQREAHPDYPLKWANGQAQLSLPRMVAQQFNSIGAQTIMGPTRNKILEELMRMMADKKPNYFFTVYVVIFVMLHEASVACADRRRYAEQNSEGRPYSLPDFVEGLQEGCNILLCYWHYYKRGFHPLNENFRGDKSHRAVWNSLRLWQQDLLARTCREYQARDRDPLTRKPHDQRWDDEFHFISQMFVENWQPGEWFRS